MKIVEHDVKHDETQPGFPVIFDGNFECANIELLRIKKILGSDTDMDSFNFRI